MKAVVHIGSLEEMTTISKFNPDGFVHMWYSSINAELTDEKLKLIKESGVFIVPTAIVNERALELADKEGPAFGAYAKKNYLPLEKLKECIKQVSDAGILILAGTDNGNFDLNWGDDLIDELLIYSQSGMDNIEVLRTATGNPAKAWDIPVGFLHVGDQANMILLNANPLENLENLRDIHTIWKNGISE